VHRDIKPANVMVASDGTVKVLDFGIARAIDGTTLTENATVLGTAAYMSPEQAAGRPADERSDIYSLGCVLYAMLAGHPPFSGDGAAAILHQHANIAPRPLRDEGNPVPRSLGAIVLQMLEKSPDQRPQSAAEVRGRLTTPLAGPPVTAATTPLGQITTTRRLPSSAPLIRLGAGRRWFALAGSLAGVIGVVLAIVLSSNGGSPRRTASDRHASTAKATAAKTRSHQTTPATTSTTTNSPTSTQVTGVKPRTVSAAAGALTALVTQDVQAGTIDQQAAQQISNGLTNVLNPWDMGNVTNAQQQLRTLSQQVTMLEQQGRITSRAAPAINAAITNLGTTLASTTPPTTANAHPPAHPTHPGPRPAKPGHGGQPPGHAKHPGPHGH
jgi:serine/threonine-protein kinase